ASIQNMYGSFGVGVEKDESTGMYTVLAPRDGMSADTYAWVYSLRSYGPKYGPDGFNEKLIFEEPGGDASKIELDKAMRQYAKEAYPNVSYTVDQLNTLSTLYTDILSYVSVNQATWVTEGGIEQQWDGYLEQLDRMGYQDFIKIQNDAYDTYKANE
ncbi:MAG: hypothetical protein K2G55_21345, partial [Lachnospiraceae bacterium]|nr:hypothetical protein [Lachnospiraceae bacterium]